MSGSDSRYRCRSIRIINLIDMCAFPLFLALFLHPQEAAVDASASASKTGHGVPGAFNSAGSSIKGAAHNVGDKVSHAADKVRKEGVSSTHAHAGVHWLLCVVHEAVH